MTQTDIVAGGQTSGLWQSLAGLADPLSRVAVGLFLMPHGAQKLFGMFGADRDKLAMIFGRIGYDPGWLWVLAAGSIEFFGGLLIVLGLFTRPAALVATGFLLVAAKTQAPMGWFWTGQGMEYALFWALMSFCVVLRGGGALSLDRRFGLGI